MPLRSPARRRYLIYHPVVTKLLVAMVALGLLMLIASSGEGKQSLDGIRAALRDHVVWTALLLALLFLISTLSPFFPEFMLSVAAGFIFGVALGSVFAVAAITVGASANFAIARRDGRRVVELVFDRQSASEIDWTATRITPAMIFLTWLLPSINFDLISYAAGMSHMRYRLFLALTVSGTVLSSVILSFLGDSLHSGPAVTVVAVLMVYTLVGTLLYAKELPPWFGAGELPDHAAPTA